jgi:uncharacterized membrane protein (DUF485 family)
MPFLLVLYFLFVGAIAWSALRHRRPGWVSGLIFAILLATLPLWVMAGIHIYQALLPK